MAGSKKVELLNLITEQNVQILKNQDDIEGLLSLNDGPSIDAFGRLRTSSPETIFESKQIFDNQPLFWDDQEVSGGGTNSKWSQDQASTVLSVDNNIAGKRVRQTFQRFNYQPGKSHQIIMTGVIGGGLEVGITKRMGYFDEENGLFLQNNNGTVSFVRRSHVTGSAVDEVVPQDQWSLDKMDGSGPSGLKLDYDKFQIFYIDFGWLGGDRIRIGFIVNGIIYYCHEFLTTNVLETVYMSTPNLPLRFEIENDGTGSESQLVQICGVVITEGGQDLSGALRYTSTGGTHIDADEANTAYAIIGIRLKAACKGATIRIPKYSLINIQSDDFECFFVRNPTLAFPVDWTEQKNSCVETGVGNTKSTVEGGTLLDGCMIKGGNSTGSIAQDIQKAIPLGTSIDGRSDEIYLCVRPLTSNADIEGSLTWREIS